MEATINFLNAHALLLGGLAAASILTFVGTLLIIPLLIIRLPEDYFAHHKRQRLTQKPKHLLWGTAFLAGKNILGGLCVLMGIIMLMTPGQGLLTILIGITLLDFPGKYRFQRRLVEYEPVLKAINRIRRAARREPLILGE